MSVIDPRIVRVTLSIGDRRKIFTQPLAITAKGKRYGSPVQNEGEITLANLDADDVNYIMTTYSVWNQGLRRGNVTVEAGRKSTGYALVFTGVVISATQGQPPDQIITLKAIESWFGAADLISTSASKSVSLSIIAKQVAESLGVPLRFEATDKQVSNWSVTGSKQSQIVALQKTGVQAFVDNGVLIVKDRARVLGGYNRILTAETGMIGVPEITELGIKVKYLFDNTSRLGGQVTIKSKKLPSVNGLYTIYDLDFDIATRAQPFYWTASCVRYGRTLPAQ